MGDFNFTNLFWALLGATLLLSVLLELLRIPYLPIYLAGRLIPMTIGTYIIIKNCTEIESFIK